MIEEILPAQVACASSFGDLAETAEGGLFPAEAAAIAKAVAKRREEFTTVRLCARRALGELGLPPVPLVPGKRGATVWPQGVVGTMTHCAGFRAAAVARATDLTSLGIDAEPNLPLPEGVLEVVARPAETARLAELARSHPAVSWDRLLFSAKESVFKTWYPLTGLELDFEEAELDIDPEAGTFRARLQVPGPLVAGERLDVFEGKWLARRGFVVTAIALEAAASES
ncbi:MULTISPECIES: 4'-phosphopantetheinyl transferase [Streptomyces]|uniref:Phosphopantetheinyl transferase n=1 Tax=Streptomyces albus (strain ATCC 21838 / DSM 41398 / FERM P-419 / JCM 4703 / NBRC 107858) TaxID=1081613 RepID=A0A0B5ER83_STRA4|nr:4'-phosphopantetheinyl transferase superfamily protein [Streptomyces sp. SCSIO ZS0520]AJE81281.1 phosphopantetheinyl transferase [Streptomyces albus]AOU75596.1 phosphopantetheinyl transferase [Streptomyces albus]AYN31401.1 4'-phosphopantetheinyl transferase [Streptomyces albus]